MSWTLFYKKEKQLFFKFLKTQLDFSKSAGSTEFKPNSFIVVEKDSNLTHTRLGSFSCLLVVVSASSSSSSWWWNLLKTFDKPSISRGEYYHNGIVHYNIVPQFMVSTFRNSLLPNCCGITVRKFCTALSNLLLGSCWKQI